MQVFYHEVVDDPIQIILNKDPAYELKTRRGKYQLLYNDQEIKLTLLYPKSISPDENQAIIGIISDIQKLGIKVDPQTVTSVSWKERLKGENWDLAYMSHRLDVDSSVSAEYNCNGEGNWSKYCNNELDKLFSKEEEASWDKEISCGIHQHLHYDYVSLFLWNPFKTYVFNHTLLYSDKIETNQYDFFTNPENWHLNK